MIHFVQENKVFVFEENRNLSLCVSYQMIGLLQSMKGSGGAKSLLGSNTGWLKNFPGQGDGCTVSKVGFFLRGHNQRRN